MLEYRQAAPWKPRDYRYLNTKSEAKPLERFKIKVITPWGMKQLADCLTRAERQEKANG
jgi:hypothetical protein